MSVFASSNVLGKDGLAFPMKSGVTLHLLVVQQSQQLRLELTREAVDAAVAAAEAILVKAATPHDQQRLAQEYLSQLQ